MIRMLWTSFVAALAAIPLVLAAQDERPTFRSNIDLIPLPVRVLDEAGRPVEDLAARDFIVRFDGADRTVVSAARVSALDAPEAKRPAPSRSYSTNDQASSPVTRTILFVFDASGLNTSTARAVGSEIERFLDKADAGDLIGITTLPVGVAVAPTTDRELVRATARKLAGAAEPSSSRFQITPGEAIGFEREDRGLMEDVVSRECFGFSDPACAQLVERDAKLMARTLRESVRRRLRTLVAVIEALPPTAEPKHIVLATAGMPHEPGLQSYYRDVPERLAARAATLSILRIESSAGTAESRLMTTGPDWRLMAEALVLMASASGGDLIEAGTASTRFERFRQELGAYYLVGISASPQDLDGKPHRVVVAVRGAGMVVQHSPTFARPRTSPRQEQLEQLLAASMERTGTTRAIPLGVQTTIVRGQDPKRLQAIVIVRTSHPAAQGALIGLAVRTGSEIVAAQTGRLDEAQRVGGVLSHVSTIAVPPGRHQLRVAVVDAQGQEGSVNHTFAADLHAAGKVLLSDLIVGQPAGTGPVRPAIDVSNERPVSALLELYSFEPVKEPPAVTMTISALADPSVRREAPAQVERTDVEGIQRAVSSIDARGLPAGEYLVRASVRSGGGVSMLDRHVVVSGRATSAPATAPSASGVPGEIPLVVRYASRYAEGYLKELSNVLMDETYRQEQRVLTRLNVRTLEAEVLFVSLPAPVGPTAFRDVFSVDGRQIRDRDDRLQRLFATPQPSAFDQAQRILQESAKHNLGAAVRTLNLPTAPLLFLRAEHLARMQWTTAGDQQVANRRFTRVRFREQQTPTLLRTPRGGDVAVTGEFLIDVETGAVSRAELSMVVRDDSRRSATPELDARIGVEFRRHDAWGQLVPGTMTERYLLQSGEENTARAEYANYRRFRVETSDDVTPRQP